MSTMTDKVKDFYSQHHDRIINKRYNSPYWIRRYAHRQIHIRFLPYVKPGQRVLDVGCGEGVLSCLLAQQGIDVIGVEISTPNIKGAQCLAEDWGAQVIFLQGDAENLSFPDNSFDVVLSSHVLEHLPHMEKGLRELYRITRSLALIAMPTCLNPSCWALLGGAPYWKLSKRSFFAVPLGFTRMVAAWLGGNEGPDEGYAGSDKVPHIWRFPWVMRQQIESVGFRITQFEAGPLIMPYLAQYVPVFRPLYRYLDRYHSAPVIRELGYGSMAVCEKLSTEEVVYP